MDADFSERRPNSDRTGGRDGSGRGEEGRRPPRRGAGGSSSGRKPGSSGTDRTRDQPHTRGSSGDGGRRFSPREGQRAPGRASGPGDQRGRNSDPATVPSGQRRGGRADEPAIPETVTADELDKTVRRDLQSLDRKNAESVARHLVMAGTLVDSDPEAALAHARAARERAGRIAAVREAVGISAYHAGEWAESLSELRAARRMAGGPGLVAVMADCERGLGRPERAIELGRSDEARALTGDQAIELRIVVAGARMDLGKPDAAVVSLQGEDLDPSQTGSTHARLFYAYADALLAADRPREACEWFLNSASADVDGETDAEDRVAELSGDGA
ncbi:MAG: hypothetical protein L0H59_18715 [Tomitella sp.]|nr:hypothetical protein [Tomitella sp.]